MASPIRDLRPAIAMFVLGLALSLVAPDAHALTDFPSTATTTYSVLLRSFFIGEPTEVDDRVRRPGPEGASFERMLSNSHGDTLGRIEASIDLEGATALPPAPGGGGEGESPPRTRS